MSSQQLFKLTTESCIHNGHEYKEGLNIDPIEWNDVGECSAGGFYSTTLENIPLWLKYAGKYMVWVWDAEIPENSPKQEQKFKIKSHQLILTNKRRIEELEIWSDREFCLKAVKKSCHAFRFVHSPLREDLDFQTEVLKINGHCIVYISNASEALQIIAVRSHPTVLKRIQNPSLNVQLSSVQIFPNNIGFIKHPSEQIQIAAIKFGNVLKIYEMLAKTQRNISERVKFIAVSRNHHALHLMNNPSSEIQLAALSHNREKILNCENCRRKLNPASIRETVGLRKRNLECESTTAKKLRHTN